MNELGLRTVTRLAALLLAAPLLAVSDARAHDFPIGDCNCSGTVEAGDPICVVRRLIGAFEPDSCIPPQPATLLYPADRTHSPLTPAIVERLQSIAAGAERAADVFAKVGDSLSVTSSFLACFVGTDVDLAGRDQLEPTRSFFAAGDAAGDTPFDRDSLAATVGWTAGAAIAGNPSPLEQETTAIDPRYAVVMFGTNDINAGTIFTYADNMLTLTDELIAAGVVPLLSSIPPRDDSASADEEVPRFNAVVRGIAQARTVPFVDLELELRRLTGHGTAGDGIHLSTYLDGTSKPCVFTHDGLGFGNNVRNLLTLESLHRARLAVEQGIAADATAPALAGAGTAADPYVIESLPFADVRDTSAQGERNIDSYSCIPGNDESGPEVVYRLDLTETTDVRAFVFDRGNVDVDIHLVDDTLSGSGCIAAHDGEVAATLSAGTYYLVLDTFVEAATELSGEYLLTVLEE